MKRFTALVDAISEVDTLESFHNLEGSLEVQQAIDPEYDRAEKEASALLNKIAAELKTDVVSGDVGKLDSAIGLIASNSERQGMIEGFALGLRVAGFSREKILGALSAMFPCRENGIGV